MVRRDVNLNSKKVKKLTKGTIVTVAEVRGRRCKISSPVEGWASLRKQLGKILLEPVPIKYPQHTYAFKIENFKTENINYDNRNVISVVDGSQASTLGIQEGWVIKAVNSKVVTNTTNTNAVMRQALEVKDPIIKTIRITFGGFEHNEDPGTNSKTTDLDVEPMKEQHADPKTEADTESHTDLRPEPENKPATEPKVTTDQTMRRPKPAPPNVAETKEQELRQLLAQSEKKNAELSKALQQSQQQIDPHNVAETKEQELRKLLAQSEEKNAELSKALQSQQQIDTHKCSSTPSIVQKEHNVESNANSQIKSTNELGAEPQVITVVKDSTKYKTCPACGIRRVRRRSAGAGSPSCVSPRTEKAIRLTTNFTEGEHVKVYSRQHKTSRTGKYIEATVQKIYGDGEMLGLCRRDGKLVKVPKKAVRKLRQPRSKQRNRSRTSVNVERPQTRSPRVSRPSSPSNRLR